MSGPISLGDETPRSVIFLCLKERDLQDLNATSVTSDASNSWIYLSFSGTKCAVSGSQFANSCDFLKRLRFVSISSFVEDICDKCFYCCYYLTRVTFSDSALLKRIGVEAFLGCYLTEIKIPDSVEEICDRCFHNCTALRRVANCAKSTYTNTILLQIGR